jgi:hypothetical protein
MMNMLSTLPFTYLAVLRSQWIWTFRVRLMLSSPNIRLISARVSVALPPRYAQNLMHTRCRIHREIVSFSYGLTFLYQMIRNSLVSMTSYGLDYRGSLPGRGNRYFSTLQSVTLGSKQPTIQCAPVSVFLFINAAGAWRWPFTSI